ncbi:MAG: hypothetical protein EXQ63_06230 [Ilumatobacteraceae bacterium]|nr:hypothetical protein [Ilumatobacteraceae bacterium]
MSMLILLIVGAAWMAVLLPPLFRSRIDSRPVSSVSDFRRQLYTLQRTQTPMRGQEPLRAMSRPLAPTPAHLRPIMRVGQDSTRSFNSPEIAYMSAGAIVRRRRTNVLYALIGATGMSLFLALTTGTTSMIWFFAVAVVSLVGYCYMLVQIRSAATVRKYQNSRRRVA